MRQDDMASEGKAPDTPAKDKQEQEHCQHAGPAGRFRTGLPTRAADVFCKGGQALRCLRRLIKDGETLLKLLHPRSGIELKCRQIAAKDSLAEDTAWQVCVVTGFEFKQVPLGDLGDLADGLK